MGLDNSTIQDPLPGDLQARVENALNSVTSAEAEYNRLTKFIVNQKSEINALHEDRKVTEATLKDFKSQLLTSQKELDQTNKTLDSVQHQVKDLEHEIAQATNQKQAILNEIDKVNNNLNERQKNVEDLEANLAERMRVLSDKETSHKIKVDKLSEALK